MSYTDAEVDAVALAIANAERADDMLPPASHVDQVLDPDSFRRHARAALAARDALFEPVGERWEARGDSGLWRRCPSRDAAHRERTQLALLGHESARVVRVVTKRRKR
jgi:hypothetical protein